MLSPPISAQMAEDMVYDGVDWILSTCLHGTGFPLMFWRVLQHFGYSEPPTYVGKQVFGEENWCIVHVAVPTTPAYPTWEPWTVSATGTELHDT